MNTWDTIRTDWYDVIPSALVILGIAAMCAFLVWMCVTSVSIHDDLKAKGFIQVQYRETTIWIRAVDAPLLVPVTLEAKP